MRNRWRKREADEDRRKPKWVRRKLMDEEGTMVTMTDGTVYTVTASGTWKKIREADHGRRS